MYIVINGHEITGANLTEIAEKFINRTTSYNVPWAYALGEELQKACADGEDAAQALTRILTESESYHLGWTAHDNRETVLKMLKNLQA